MPTHLIRARDARGDDAADIDRSDESIQAHIEDAAHFAGGHADGVARPRTEREVARLIGDASRVLPVGAQSSLTGGATPDGGLVLTTARFSAIHESGQHHFRIGSGVPIAVLQELLRESGRWYAPSPTFAGAFAGGVVATNAAGAATFKYGTTRAWTDGLTVVLACGHVLDLTRGGVVADPSRGFEVVCDCGTRWVTPGTYRMPNVPKCSAGYFASPAMDLVDLFIGAEGTLGIITEVVLRVLPEPPSVAWALVPVTSESSAIALVDSLRRESQRTWQSRDPHGVDIAAIEHVDRRCLEMLREDGIDKKCDITIPQDADLMLLVQLELPAGVSADQGFAEVGMALSDDAADSPIVRFCRLLHHHDALDATEIAWPGDRRRAEQFIAFREAAPVSVNRRVGEIKRTVDDRAEKTAADMIVPFDRFAEMMAIYREGYRRRGLDFAIWGHISDGNVHPNVIPRSYADVVAGREAILQFGQAVARLGGCPLAEHGVGRSTVKHALLRQLYGDDGLNQMRAIKNTLDPDWKLSPGVLFHRAPA